MDLRVKEQLDEADIALALKNIIRENLAFQAMATFTGGVFIVAFASDLGATNFFIGLIAAIGPFAQLLQIPAIFLVDRVQNRRLICVVATIIARLMWPLIAILPFVLIGPAALPFLLLGLGLHSGFSAISNCSWGSWMRDVIPQDRMGAFFSRRMLLSTIVGMILNVLAGVYIDGWERVFPTAPLIGYSLMFTFGGIIGILGVYLFTARIPEPRLTPSQGKVFTLLAQPFRDTNFRNLMIFEGTWNFAMNLAGPFFTVYMLQWLNFDLTSIVLLATLSQITNILFIRTWGRLVDQYSNKAVLSFCAGIMIACVFLWTFATLPDRYALTVPLLVLIHVASGIASAGVGLASGNMGLKLAPRGQATAFLASRSLINSLAATVAPILGGRFADLFKDAELALTLTWTSPGQSFALQTLDFQHWDFFFFLAFLIGMYALFRLTLVQESGDVTNRVVVMELMTEMKRGMRNFSTIKGLYQIIYFPFSLLRDTTREDENKQPEIQQQ